MESAQAAHRAIPELTDEIGHLEVLPDQDFWMDNLFTVVAQSEGHDILFQHTIIAMRDRGGGVYLGDTRKHYVQMVAVPSGGRNGGMRDNNFVSYGTYFPQFGGPESLTITQTADSVIWETNGVEVVSAPPEWRLRGTYGNVEMDLRFTQSGDAEWTYGPFERLRDNGRGGYHCFARVSGTLTVEGRTFRIDENASWAGRERMASGQSLDYIDACPVTEESGWYWLMGKTPEVIVYANWAPGIDAHASVQYDGETYTFDPRDPDSEVRFEVTERWNDPRSGLHMPCRWELTGRTPQGSVKIDFSTHGRFYSLSPYGHGMMSITYLIGIATGTFVTADGREVRIEDALMMLDWGKTISVSEQGLSGPRWGNRAGKQGR